ncbi:hypothetical protein TELCIR_07371 [Teladorsagia circumcincta]|uniref:Uncharacterized protein n=1 Tax=Teladorsagia circumcincta TaxID=45464 RepID=A0A2G9UKU5_TELCI|nr:hypothetical protein TELCIR_07371 [Teladorsagia circumcincta]
MDNFTAFFDAFETRVHYGNENLLQRQQSNTMKQVETVACLKEKIARYKQQENEQRTKRENAEHQRKELMGKLSKMRAKMSDISSALARVAGSEKQLRSHIQYLKQPATSAPQDIAAIQELKSNVRVKLKRRSDAFDLTALIAEVQAIEQQGKERQKMSEELHEKFGYSSAQVVDNEMLQERLDSIQNELSSIEDERTKLAGQKYAIDNRLMEITSQEENSRKEIAAVESELNDVEHQALELKQKQAEVEAQIASTSLELEEMRAKVKQDEETLQVSKKDHENKKLGTLAELEKVENDFHYQSDQMLEQLENGRNAVEEAQAEARSSL